MEIYRTPGIQFNQPCLEWAREMNLSGLVFAVMFFPLPTEGTQAIKSSFIRRDWMNMRSGINAAHSIKFSYSAYKNG